MGQRSVPRALSLANYLATIFAASYFSKLRILAAQRIALTQATSTQNHFVALRT